MRKSIGYIGVGKTTRFLLQGFENRKVNFKRIVVSDYNPIVLEKLKIDFPLVEIDNASVAAAQDIVIMDMDQNILIDTIELISDDFKNDPIVISLVPNVNFAKLTLRLQGVYKVARVLPTPAMYINEAYTPISFSPAFTDSDKADVLGMFGFLGKVIEVQEEKLQTYSIMSALIPAYFWYQWQELIDMGLQLGLKEQEVMALLNEGTISALHLKYKYGLTEQQVIDMMQVSPVEQNESELKEAVRNRLVDLYRRIKPEIMESNFTSTTISKGN